MLLFSAINTLQCAYKLCLALKIISGNSIYNVTDAESKQCNNVTTESFRNIFIGFKSTHKHFLIFSNWVHRTRKLQSCDY